MIIRWKDVLSDIDLVFAGVYAILDGDDAPVYIGQSGHILSRLIEHWAGRTHPVSKFLFYYREQALSWSIDVYIYNNDPSGLFDYSPFGTERERRKLEREMIAKYGPELNTNGHTRERNAPRSRFVAEFRSATYPQSAISRLHMPYQRRY